MVYQRGTLEVLADELGSALAALQDVLRVDTLSTLFLELGLDDPPAVGGDPQFVQKVTAAADQCSALDVALEDLAQQVEADDLAGVLEAVAHVIEAIVRLTVDLDAVATDLKRATVGAADAVKIAAFTEQMAGRLLEAAVVRYLETVHPIIESILAVLTVVEVTPLPQPSAPPPVEGAGDGVSVIADATQTVPLAQRRLHLDRLGQLFQDPLAFLKTAYDWGDESFDGKKLFVAVSQFFDALGPLSVIDEAGDAAGILSFFALSFAPTTNVHPPGIDGFLHVDLAPSTDLVIARPGENWRFSLGLADTFGAGLEMRFLPSADLAILPPEGTLDGEVRLGFSGESPDPQRPFVIFGQTRGSHLEASRVEAGLVANLKWDVGAGRARADVGFEAKAVEGKVVIDFSQADGFLKSILPADGITTTVNLDVTCSPRDGIRINGKAGLRASITMHSTAGPLRLDTLNFGLEPTAQSIALAATLTGSVTLGPFVATVDGVGTAAELHFGRGNLGPVDLNVGFRPPSGVGLSVDAGVLAGGGFIRLDPASGRYSGVLDLHSEKIGLTALGLLDTKLPAGQSGYALLLALRATFPAVQIGFGFALTGVGGLLALNRRVDVDALRGRLAAGTAGRVLAPQDPVRNAPALLADLDAVFPVAAGITVVGPTVQLLWAGLVHLDVGVFIELPGPARVVLLGSAHAEIERDGRAYLSIRVDIVGVVDLRGETAAFDAVLIDSHLMGMLDLTGGAAFRLSWGAQPYAVLSLGGFNPAYDPEPLSFPSTLTRIAMVHGTPSDELYLRFEGYFAITSNTLQFGASVEVMIQSDHFIVHGSVGFDALIQRSPFHFRFDIRASVTVAYRGHTLAGLTLTGSLTGPGPVVVQAKVCIELLFFDICFSGTFPLGPAIAPLLAAAADLLDTLLGELDNPATLRAAGAPDPYVRLQPPDPSLTTAVIAPSGTLVWEQQSAPLDLLLTRVGGAPLPAPAQVSATSPASSTAQSDWFAPGQFIDLTDDQALTRPAYERLTGGLRLAGAGVADGPGAQALLTTTQIRLPADAATPGKPVVMFPAWILTSAAGPATPAIAVRTESWIVTTPAGDRSDLTGAQARQLAALTTSSRAIPATDRLAAFTF
jgi:hypothetical protein